MKTLWMATTNEEKVREAQAVLKHIRLKQINIDVPEVKTTDMKKTIEEKAKAAYALVKKPVLVEDTGFFLDAYPGFPGTYTKFCVKLLGLESFLRLVRGKSRKAHFETWVAFFDGKKTVVVKGAVKGKMTTRLRGKTALKLPYDLIFIPEGHRRTFAEMSPEEKSQISHRAKAFRELEKVV